ncbi:hypothetical protein COCCADRAFT_102413 [Bipolaris zeicola 26-R-13]|uniref:Uncharacterized protein n=1 Tax=Cochliobolus carbonum (strain 26-R-13) TaxID=930089 RepID=W6XZ55_COCC2|nr:uncharacterized protein COCCADRAFT_102413 [Bipolaris zeicola 26-R-13]EUC31018.1 hypothetical protein COCCADRAFT_102413 [Bipolaris zeicola 26-R-13]
MKANKIFKKNKNYRLSYPHATIYWIAPSPPPPKSQHASTTSPSYTPTYAPPHARRAFASTATEPQQKRFASLPRGSADASPRVFPLPKKKPKRDGESLSHTHHHHHHHHIIAYPSHPFPKLRRGGGGAT